MSGITLSTNMIRTVTRGPYLEALSFKKMTFVEAEALMRLAKEKGATHALITLRWEYPKPVSSPPHSKRLRSPKRTKNA